MEKPFLCPNQPGGLTLVPSACARMYQKGKRAEKWESAHHCKGCAIGAGHAGEVAPVKQAVEPGERCDHCGAPAFRLVYGYLCISCYNRLAEALKGRNARGQEPKKIRAKHAGDLAWATMGGITYLAVRGQVRVAKAMTHSKCAEPSPQGYLFDTI